MAPSVTETVSYATDQIQEKLAAVTVKDAQANDVKPTEDVAPAVHEPKVNEKQDVTASVVVDQQSKQTEEPKVETQHREPLKLSGVLESFDSFDVTPTIGREFVGVNLAKWLRAPNSDELLRDLAITSMCKFIIKVEPANSH